MRTYQSICFYLLLVLNLEIKSKTNPTTTKPKNEVKLQGLGVGLESAVAGSEEAPSAPRWVQWGTNWVGEANPAQGAQF